MRTVFLLAVNPSPSTAAGSLFEGWEQPRGLAVVDTLKPGETAASERVPRAPSRNSKELKSPQETSTLPLLLLLVLPSGPLMSAHVRSPRSLRKALVYSSSFLEPQLCVWRCVVPNIPQGSPMRT